MKNLDPWELPVFYDKETDVYTYGGCNVSGKEFREYQGYYPFFSSGLIMEIILKVSSNKEH